MAIPAAVSPAALVCSQPSAIATASSADMAAVRLPVFHIMAGPYSVDTAPVAGSTSTSVVASPEASLNST